MAATTTYTCDRCGKTIAKDSKTGNLKMKRVAIYNIENDTGFDLCMECVGKLNLWLHGGTDYDLFNYNGRVEEKIL